MNILNIVILISMLLFTVSCSTTIDFHVPTQSFVTPEVVGRTLGGRAQATYSNSVKYRVARLEQASIFSSQINVSTEEGSTKDNIVNATFGLGLGNAVELYHRLYMDSASIWGAKLQLLGRDGETRSEGYKMAFFAGGGSGTVDEKTITATNGDGASRSYNAVLKVRGLEYGFSLGHRFNKNFLLYTSGTVREHKAKTELTSDSYDDLSIVGRSQMKQLSIGLTIDSSDKSIYVIAEGGWVELQWKDQKNSYDYALGASIGLRF
jgi:hypothetical protein